MPKLLQINVSANKGSTGKIAEQIGLLAKTEGWESWLAYGRSNNNSSLNTIRIGNDADIRMHGIQSRFFDNHGLASAKSTRQFIEKIREIKPDVIHLHNIHGYYLNYPILFDYVKAWGGPVVWTLHDCWPFTGHCAYFMMNGCEKWKIECHNCPSIQSYPKSLFWDGSIRNFQLKKKYFSAIASQLTLVPVSNYMANYLSDSFLRDAKVQVIHNGIDLSIFHPYEYVKERIVLGVANVWEPRKGLFDFFELRKLLTSDWQIKLIGLSKKQLKELPPGIEGITRTANQHELAKLYSSASVLVNPTYEDNYPTVNLEAIACGTPVITYRTGGSPESITSETGIVLPKGDINGIAEAINTLSESSRSKHKCRKYAESHFDQANCFWEYIKLYNTLL